MGELSVGSSPSGIWLRGNGDTLPSGAKIEIYLAVTGKGAKGEKGDPGTGDISGVTAGSGLTGGGDAGDVNFSG